MATILVTGGAGYIGSHTCKALAGAGHVPVAYDNLVSGHREAVRWGPFEHGDILDRGRLDDVLARHRPEAVIHFAAYAYVGESIVDPGKYYRNNLAGTVSLVQAMVANGVTRLVFSSSCAVYGIPATIPIAEDCPCAPINPYGMSKLMAERVIADFHRPHGLDWIGLRYFNAAGDDPDGEVGEDHDPETRVVPLVLAAAAGRGGPFTILGTDYDTPDGTCIRDFIHVADLADAHVRAIDVVGRPGASGPVNLGTGRGYSVREIVRAVERATQRRVPVREGARRDGDPPVLIADARKASDLLDWRPVRSDLDTIVTTAWNWAQGLHAR